MSKPKPLPDCTERPGGRPLERKIVHGRLVRKSTPAAAKRAEAAAKKSAEANAKKAAKRSASAKKKSAKPK